VELFEDGARGLCPDEGARVLVVLLDIAIDRRLEVHDGAEVAALQAPARECREKALDGVDPGRRGRGEVEHPARMPGEPGAHPRVLVGGVVVEHDMDHLARRHRGLDLVEEADELLVPVALHAAADHGAVEDVQRGKQRRRAVALIVVGHRRRPSGGDGRSRPRPREGLDLALLVDREHDRVGGRVHVEADDVLDLLGEGGVVRALEGPHPVRLQAMRLPDPLHGAQREADHRRHRAAGPVRGLARRLRAGDREHLGDVLGRRRRLARRTSLVAQQPLDALFGVALLPAPHRGPARAGALGDLEDRQAVVGVQHDAGALDVLEGPGAIADDGRKALAVIGGEDHARGLSHTSQTRTYQPILESSECV